MPVADEMLPQRPHVVLPVVAPEDAHEGSAEMCGVVEELPSKDDARQVERHDRLNRRTGWELELR